MSIARSKMHIDPLYARFGIEEIVFAELYDLDNTIPLDANAEGAIAACLQQMLDLQADELECQPVLVGYRAIISALGRSKRKFPPSALALLEIVQRCRQFPRINSLVDIYNISALHTLLSFGAHDLDKISGVIEFRLATEGEHFCAIGNNVRKVAAGDLVYADQDNILAWLDTRDSELVKINRDCRNALLVLQGNQNTDRVLREQTLRQVGTDVCRVCGGRFAIFSTDVEGRTQCLFSSEG